MKLKCFNVTIIVITMFLFVACHDKEDDLNEPNTLSIEYYVKYELKTSSKYVYSTVEATLNTEKGLVTMTIPINWEGTFGPFTQLENVIFKIKCEPDYIYNTSTYNGRISICRGNQPYILKADKTISNAPLDMQYDITTEDLK